MFGKAKERVDDGTSWNKAFSLYRGQLRFYLDYLIQCTCADDILARIEAGVDGTHVPDEFKLRFMVRSLARHTIEHLRECQQCGETSKQDLSYSSDFPTLERLVYFLRDILEYSTRDASLLVGISDAQVERLASSARKRLDINEGPSSAEIQEPNWTCFRWKFENLRLGC